MHQKTLVRCGLSQSDYESFIKQHGHKPDEYLEIYNQQMAELDQQVAFYRKINENIQRIKKHGDKLSKSSADPREKNVGEALKNLSHGFRNDLFIYCKTNYCLRIKPQRLHNYFIQKAKQRLLENPKLEATPAQKAFCFVKNILTVTFTFGIAPITRYYVLGKPAFFQTKPRRAANLAARYVGQVFTKELGKNKVTKINEQAKTNTPTLNY